MIKILCDGEILHDMRIADQGYYLINPSLTMEVNKQGTLSFDVSPTHPRYTSIRKLKSIIDVYQDNELLFSGRVINDEYDMNNIKKCSCEGELAYLLDSVQELGEYHNISVKDFFSLLISRHNEQVDESKRFVVGTVNVIDNNDSLYRYTNYEKTWDAINEKLINRLGGKLRTRRENSNKVIDYISDYENVNTQAIEFGENLIDFKKSQRGENIATVLIPLGAKIEGETSETVEKRLTIADVNNGKIYLEDKEAIALYGRIVDVATFEDVSVAANLKTKGQNELTTRRLLDDSVELTAVDLHGLNINVERIKLGDKIRVYSIPHGIDTFLSVTKMQIDLANPANTKITLGKTQKTLTDASSANKTMGKVTALVKSYGYGTQIKENGSKIKEVADALIEFGQEVNNGFATVKDLNGVKEDLLKAIAETDSKIEELKELIGKANGKITIDAAAGGVAIGKTATENGKVDIAEPAIFRQGLTAYDGQTAYDVLEIIKSIGGNSNV